MRAPIEKYFDITGHLTTKKIIESVINSNLIPGEVEDMESCFLKSPDSLETLPCTGSGACWSHVASIDLTVARVEENRPGCRGRIGRIPRVYGEAAAS